MCSASIPAAEQLRLHDLRSICAEACAKSLMPLPRGGLADLS